MGSDGGGQPGASYDPGRPFDGVVVAPGGGSFVPGKTADLTSIGIDPNDLSAFYGSAIGQKATGAQLADFGGVGANGKFYSKNGQDLTDTVNLFRQWFSQDQASLAAHRAYVYAEGQQPGRASTVGSSSSNLTKSILGPGPQDLRKTVLG